MKVLHVVPSYIPAYRYGGPIESVHALNKALVALGAEVEVFTTNKDVNGILDVKTGVPTQIDGVKVTYFPVSFPRFWCYSPSMKKALVSRIAEFDVIHITSVFLYQSFIGARLAKKFGKPYIISPRGSLMSDPLKRKGLKKKIYISLFEKGNLRGARAIHFTTKHEEGGYARNLPIIPSFIIPNVISPLKESNSEYSFKKEFGIKDEAKIVLFAGRLHPIKGFDVLLPAFSLVSKEFPDVLLVIAGADENGYKKEIERVSKSLSIENKVIFTGMLSDEKKASAFRSANILILPSHSENFGMSAGEAMSLGVPVVVTDSVGISDTISETESGIVIKRDSNICAKAISEILKNPDLAKRMSENGTRATRENFSPQSVAEKMLREYNKIIKK